VSRPAGARGAVLMEVIIALFIFVAAAAIVTSGINASMQSVERQRLSAQSLDLAVSVISEVQMGLRSAAGGGPEAFGAPFDEWTWELQSTPLQSDSGEASSLTKVEVVIRHKTSPMVQRLAQVIRPASPKTERKETRAGALF
jgi:hypothetical protein